MAVQIIKHLIESASVGSKTVNDVIVGCANPEGEQGLQVNKLISTKNFGN